METSGKKQSTPSPGTGRSGLVASADPLDSLRCLYLRTGLSECGAIHRERFASGSNQMKSNNTKDRHPHA